jgi:hypothetical protein
MFVFRQRNSKNLTVVHQHGKNRMERRVEKNKRRDLPQMLRSKYLISSCNEVPQEEGKPR